MVLMCVAKLPLKTVDPPEWLEHMIMKNNSASSPVDHHIGARLGDQERASGLDRISHKTAGERCCRGTLTAHVNLPYIRNMAFNPPVGGGR